jgi:hypothetical protein
VCVDGDAWLKNVFHVWQTTARETF